MLKNKAAFAVQGVRLKVKPGQNCKNRHRMRGLVTGRFISLVLAAALACGCAKQSLNPDYRGPAPLPRSISQVFLYEKNLNGTDETVTRRTSGYDLIRLRVAREPGEAPVVADYFKNKAPGKNSLILVLPILGGKNTHANKFALFFTENGYSSVVVHRKKDFRDWFDFDSIDQMTLSAVTDIRRVLDWAGTRPEIDAASIGITGISLGGMGALFATAVDPRIKAAVIMLTGGNFPYILTHSGEKRIREKRIPYMERERLTKERFHARMKVSVKLDPMGVAPYMDARKLLLILAVFDRVIPSETGRALQRKMGGPETVYLFTGHYSSGLFFSHVKRKSLGFFNRSLGS